MSVASRLTHPDVDLHVQAPLAPLSHFGSGGPAELLAVPRSLAGVIHVAKTCLEADEPLYVLGRMSNVLVSDRGLPGVTMLMTQQVGEITVDGDTVTAAAGVWLSRLAAQAAVHGLSGLEFASGIPGTLGGSILINAGAYDQEFSHVVTETTYLASDGNIRTVTGSDHHFSYRTSLFEENGCLILQSRMVLEKAGHDVYRKMAELAKKRRESQPLPDKSCGSAFKRPPGYYAGKLISDVGLKGYAKDGAGVSAKHAGFIVNHGTAASETIAACFIHVQKEVYRQFGVSLEPEVRFAGVFAEKPEHAHVLKPLFGRE